jgi:hypothetical protein
MFKEAIRASAKNPPVLSEIFNAKIAKHSKNTKISGLA